MIVATAGHVDHGKTSLVKAFTGIDTDTLAEEKRRGLSIDLGFAHADFGAAAAIGFVDVPGHERFMRNMVAGVACVDFALLVVAADDGPMPQTVEHLAILEWLNVPRCAVALTKVDRVPAERIAEVRLLIEALLAAGPFRGTPIFPVVATTGAGLDALREHLRHAAAAQVGREAAGHFRLAVDRSFTLAGAGQVVTGAVVAGRARVGDALVVSPQGLALRLRGIQVHGEAVGQVQAGQRCALNLAGAALKRASIGRGDWIVAPAAHAPTDRLDVRLGVSRTLDHALRHDSVVQLHLAATTVTARLATLEGRAIEPGSEACAQLVLAQPIGALHGDRFIVRDPGANRTLGGGRVVDPFGWPRGRARPVRLAELSALAQPSAEGAFAALLEAAAAGVDLQRFLQARNVTRLEAGPLLRTLHATVVDVRKGVVVGTLDADEHGDLRAVSPAHWQALRQRIVSALDAAHAAEPDRIGPTEAALGTILGQPAVDGVLRAALGSLVESRDVVRDGFCLRRPAHVATMAAAESAWLDRVRAVLEAAGLRPPNVGDLATALGVERSMLLAHLADLGRRGHLVQIAKNHFFLPGTVLELVRMARELADGSEEGTFDAAAYRDHSGISRNLTIEVLEFLDRAGVTRFHAGRRRIVDGTPMLR